MGEAGDALHWPLKTLFGREVLPTVLLVAVSGTLLPPIVLDQVASNRLPQCRHLVGQLSHSLFYLVRSNSMKLLGNGENHSLAKDVGNRLADRLGQSLMEGRLANRDTKFIVGAIQCPSVRRADCIFDIPADAASNSCDSCDNVVTPFS
jgi:hypothetical protein